MSAGFCGAECGDDLPGQALLDGTAVGSNDHFVSEAADLIEIVRDKQHLGAASRGCRDELLDHSGSQEADSGRRFVEKEELRLCREGSSQRKALLLGP